MTLTPPHNQRNGRLSSQRCASSRAEPIPRKHPNSHKDDDFVGVLKKNIPTKGPQNRMSLHGTPGQVGVAPNDKEEGGFPVGIGLRDPGSQKRDPTARRGTLLFHPSMLQRVQALSFLSRLALSEPAARDDKANARALRTALGAYWRTTFSTTERSFSPWLVSSPTNFSKRLNML